MSGVLRHNRKASDADIIRLNSCGLSLQTIGRLTGIHPTSVTARLKNLGIPPADTRRSFMEDVFKGLNNDEQDWLCDQMNQSVSVKDFVINALRMEHQRAKRNATEAHLELVPES